MFSFCFPRSDPDCAVLCLLAADDADDVALQIHFTLMQAFFHENDFTILRVWGLRRLQHLLGAATDGNQNQNEQQDFHCILVTVSCTDANDTVKNTKKKWFRKCNWAVCPSLSVQNPQADHCRLQEVESYYREKRLLNQWVPEIVLYDTPEKNENFHQGSDGQDPQPHVQGCSAVDVGGVFWPSGGLSCSGEENPSTIFCPSFGNVLSKSNWILFLNLGLFIIITMPTFQGILTWDGAWLFIW